MAEQQLLIIDEWAQKAFALTISDNAMGNVLCKSLHLMGKVARNGVRAPNLKYALQSMNQERELAKIIEQEPVDPLRELVLGMSESLGIMITLMIENNEDSMDSESKAPAASATANVVERNFSIATPGLSGLASTSKLFQTPIKEEEPEEDYSGNMDTDAFSSALFTQPTFSGSLPMMAAEDIKEEPPLLEPIFDYMPSWSARGTNEQYKHLWSVRGANGQFLSGRRGGNVYGANMYVNGRRKTQQPKPTWRALQKDRDQHIVCPKCKHVYSTVRSFGSHLRKQHSLNLRKAGYVLRCECGHESQSLEHTDKCDIAKFTLLHRSESTLAKPQVRARVYEMAPEFNPGSFMLWLEEHREQLTQPGMSEDELMTLAKTEWRKVEDKSKWYLEAGRRSKAMEKARRKSKQTEVIEHSRRSHSRRSISMKPETFENPETSEKTSEDREKPETFENPLTLESILRDNSFSIEPETAEVKLETEDLE